LFTQSPFIKEGGCQDCTYKMSFWEKVIVNKRVQSRVCVMVPTRIDIVSYS
jgi:hypothetical protein